jgi:inhibitor of cysteine peptidase
VILVFTAYTLLAGCATAATDKESAMNEIVVGEEDRGRLIEVVQGSRVLLRLPENPSTGYRWELEPFEGNALKLQADTYQPPSIMTPGAGGVRVIDFLSQSSGTVLLRLRLRRPWDPEDVAKAFEVTVHVTPRLER